MALDPSMLRIGGVIPLFAAIISLILAIVVYVRAPDRGVGRTFALLTVALVFWNLNFFALYAFESYATALTLSRIFRTGAVFVPPAILHLSLVLPGTPIVGVWRRFLIVDYLWSAGLALLNIAGLLVNRLEPFSWGYYSIGTSYYHLFTISVVTNFACGSALLVRHYHTTSDARMRTQLRFWLLGMSVALPLGLTNLLPVYGVRFYPLGNLGSAVWAGIVGYAIARYRLMDIEIVVTKGLSHLAAVLLAVAPSLGCAVLLQRLVFIDGAHYDFSAALVLLFLAVGVAYSRVQQAASRRLERKLFPSKFETRAALLELSREVVKVLDRGPLLRLLCERVGRAFGLDRVEVYLREETRGGFALSSGLASEGAVHRVDGGGPLARWLMRRREAVLRSELDYGVGASVAPSELPWEWAVCVPFVSGRDVLGFMVLGKRRGLQDYSAGDLGLLNEVAAGSAIALQNARLYEELGRSREIINRTGRLSALGTLAAGIAHEVRNPLVSIQTFFQLAPGRLDDEEFMTSFLKLAEAEVQRISSLITELLTFAKSPTPSVDVIDLSEIAERTTTLLEPQARADGILMRLRVDRTLPQVVADGDRIMQVILNLALNAIQATPRGGTVSLETREVSFEGVRYCQIAVIDTGGGIPEAHREAIFDPFFTTKEKGSGLGLAIAHQIVAEAGGFISVESTEGEGSRFRVHLPSDTRSDGSVPGGDRPIVSAP